MPHTDKRETYALRSDSGSGQFCCGAPKARSLFAFRLTHFILTLSQILDILQSAEQLLNGGDSQQIKIDPSLVSGRRSVRHRFKSARLSLQLGERTVQKSMGRIHEWRATVIATERKRLRKNFLDL